MTVHLNPCKTKSHIHRLYVVLAKSIHGQSQTRELQRHVTRNTVHVTRYHTMSHAPQCNTVHITPYHTTSHATQCTLRATDRKSVV